MQREKYHKYNRYKMNGVVDLYWQNQELEETLSVIMESFEEQDMVFREIVEFLFYGTQTMQATLITKNDEITVQN